MESRDWSSDVCSSDLLLLGREAFPVFAPLSPSSLLTQKRLPALRGFSLPQFASPCRGPAEFCGSGCADCCVNPQIIFLGVQDGLVWVWLYFMDARHTKNFHAVPPSWLLLEPNCFLKPHFLIASHQDKRFNIYILERRGRHRNIQPMPGR